MNMIFKLKRHYLLLSILLLGALLRLYHFDYQSVWLDEIHTLNEADPSLSWGGFYQALLTSEPHPPLYFAIVRILFSIFGYSTVVLRLFSVVLGIASIYALFVLGRELFNKKTGLIAAFLLAINYFHLYYSQDGRPYIFLILFTIMAFWRLSLYIKSPTRKNALLFGVFSTLMVYGHFFGLFALIAQYVILLIFIILIEKKYRRSFITNSIISGVVTMILLIPAVPLFIKAAGITEIWIPAPTVDVYTLIFKEFFGNAEFLLLMAAILFIACIVRLSKEDDFEVRYNDVLKRKTILRLS